MVDLDSSLREPVTEVSLVPQKAKAASFGVELSDVVGSLPLLIGGAQVANFEDAGEQYSVFLRAEERFRDDRLRWDCSMRRRASTVRCRCPM